MVTVNKGCLQKLKAQTIRKIPKGLRMIKTKTAKERKEVDRFLEKEMEEINGRFRPKEEYDDFFDLQSMTGHVSDMRKINLDY